ncbi:dihydrolipoamide acetyltransferase family protein [Amnibacterium kyonggiense]|uniref:Dihydrolipoamide acetyltransferase component of pyruvate dehydrogenase complex n=1 Tax=Amnibacterium kyonggiense TaxID=595671 RepID=A0A4R7FGB4_9MICO|nr:dihydrolipoamide acetyltransferase family protein [Amnibacterium kyonggiense]TDS75637.1 pyruvate dehydrogenase E2 component (dihydrolipoamide acetyltransferase) [Amnibacterium kyonggiense]
MASVVRMPEVLANVTEAAIASWLVQKGQTVAVGAPLAEVETEKAVVEYQAEIEGTVLELLVAEGASVAVGEPIAVIGAPGESADAASPAPGGAEEAAPAAGTASSSTPPVAAEQAATPEQASAPEPETAPEAAPSPVAGAPTELRSDGGAEAAQPTGGRRFTSPIVRRLAKEHGVDLDALQGTGPDGRIVRRDLERFLAEPREAPRAAAPAPAPAPAPSAPAGADVEEVPLTGMRRAIARRLTESKSTVPHFYVVADVRMGALLDLRSELNAGGGPKVSVNDLLVKAAAGAFLRVPDANATWAETSIRRYSSVDVAIAVAIDGGLVTPVLRGVERRSIGDVAAASADLVDRARRGRLKQDELEGGAFSISNLGMYGVKEFSAIINPPQSAILAVGAASERPVVEDGALAIATVMTVTLSADHRVIDGALAAQWLAAFTDLVEHPVRILR